MGLTKVQRAEKTEGNVKVKKRKELGWGGKEGLGPQCPVLTAQRALLWGSSDSFLPPCLHLFLSHVQFPSSKLPFSLLLFKVVFLYYSWVSVCVHVRQSKGSPSLSYYCPLFLWDKVSSPQATAGHFADICHDKVNIMTIRETNQWVKFKLTITKERNVFTGKEITLTHTKGTDSHKHTQLLKVLSVCMFLWIFSISHQLAGTWP